MGTLIAPAINVIILVALLAYYLSEPIKTFVSTRHTSLRDELQRVGNQLRQARAQYEEFTGKLKAIESEVDALRSQARQEAQLAKQRVIADAKRLSEMIVTDARGSAQGMFEELRAQLRTDLGNRVLERAETLLRERLTSDDRQRIRREFSRQVESIQ